MFRGVRPASATGGSLNESPRPRATDMLLSCEECSIAALPCSRPSLDHFVPSKGSSIGVTVSVLIPPPPPAGDARHGFCAASQSEAVDVHPGPAGLEITLARQNKSETHSRGKNSSRTVAQR